MQLTINLAQIAREANREHGEVVASLSRSLEHARRAGELLNQAKNALRHGQWAAWLGEHFEGSERSARLYMRVAREWPKLDAETGNGVAGLPLREAVKLLAKPVEFATKQGEVSVSGRTIEKSRSMPVEIAPRRAKIVEVGPVTFEKISPERAERKTAPWVRSAMDRLDFSGAVQESGGPSHPRGPSTGVIEHVEALQHYSKSHSPDDLAAEFERVSDITAADIEQLVAWLSDAAIALDRRVGQSEARQG